jgi:hypothetical protein
MFTPNEFRAKAAGYGERAQKSANVATGHYLRDREKSFAMRADNEELLANNFQKAVHELGGRRANNRTLAIEEEHVLRCLGAALIMQWNTLPQKLQRELFDNAGSVGELLATEELRGQIARFLHKHKDNGETVAR